MIYLILAVVVVYWIVCAVFGVYHISKSALLNTWQVKVQYTLIAPFVTPLVLVSMLIDKFVQSEPNSQYAMETASILCVAVMLFVAMTAIEVEAAHSQQNSMPCACERK